jgi:hypothetical protein
MRERYVKRPEDETLIQASLSAATARAVRCQYDLSRDVQYGRT